MRAQNEHAVADELADGTRPIELFTENGYSIVRRWEIDLAPPPATGEYHFVVRDPANLEREVVVELTEEVVVQIEIKSRRRILRSHSFWIVCAERHLVDYFMDHNTYPPGNKLCVDRLNPEDLLSALHWQAD